VSFSLGDIIAVDAPAAGKRKYHIYLGDNEFSIALCLFLNSKHSYVSDAVFECSRFPMIPASSTGLSVVSMSMVPRYNEHQLKIYHASKLGVLPLDVAVELLPLCSASRSLTKPERSFIVARLTKFIDTENNA